MKLTELLARRAEVSEAVQALAAIEAEGKELTAEQGAEFASLEAEFEALEGKISRAQNAERMAAASAKPVESFAEPKRHAETPLEGGDAVSLMVRSLIAGRGNMAAAAQYADAEGQPEIAAALNTGTSAAGGYIVPPGYSANFIDLLRPQTVVRKHTASVPMPAGKMTMPKMAAGSTATYVAEGDDAPKTEPQFTQLNLAAKKMTAVVPVSNDLVRFSNPGVNGIVRDDLVRSVAIREDQAFLRDDGTGNVPLGLLNIATGGNKPTAAAAVAPAAAATDTELAKLELALMSANVSLIGAYWIMSPRTFQYLQNLRDGNGNKVYPEMAGNRLRGKEIELTTTIPENLGAGTNETEIYLYQPQHGIIGDAVGVTLDVSAEASYMDGTLKSAFSRDETVVRVICEHDFGMRYDEGIAVLTGVQWGA